MAELTFSRRKLLRILIAGAAVTIASAATLVEAQGFPAKPIKLVVGYPPGGAVDGNARIIAPKLAEVLGQPVVIENRAGASGNIATEFVAHAPPDGYTILLTTIGHTITPSLMRKPPFDPIGDFVPVTQVSGTSMVLLVNPKVPANNLAEFVALAKSKPGKLNYGSPGAGDPLGLSMEVLKLTTGIDVVEVPYKGVGPIFTALIAGEIDAAFMPPSASIPYMKAGTLRALAIGSARRSPALPDLPTVAESGYPGFDAVNWQGLLLPAKTPMDIAYQYQRAIVKVLATPDIKDRLIAGGQEGVGSTPEEFTAKIRADTAKFERIIREARIPQQD
ncbi:MAG TPA: tripartite tricarboxylate transporter substrate binding protein [Casimicrobiaceae bacterium]|nr:tripartite tricarboxylate transporter substrate binding protein [Casimicrobiaceae bacterium]